MLMLKANGTQSAIELGDYELVPAQIEEINIESAPQRIRLECQNISDGRIFSNIRILRLSGYKGEILVTGVAQDQAALAFSVGADGVAINPSEKIEDWRRSAKFISGYYGTRAEQAESKNIIELRHGD